MSDINNIFNLGGILLGAATFIIIGVFHPLVIKGEYYLGQKKCRLYFALAGVITLIASLLVESLFFSALLGVTAFSCFWSIKEVIEQEERVRKGWFPANPKRKTESESEVMN
ncbi:MAG: DUF4491 family protein [Bacteroides sp.]|nr:DUF4491 family protein [Bacteroides sp.]